MAEYDEDDSAGALIVGGCILAVSAGYAFHRARAGAGKISPDVAAASPEFDDMPDLIDEDGNVVKSQEKTLQKDDKEEQSETQEINLLDIEVETENIALNLLVSFINLAQRRGAFNIAESAKIWEAIQFFMPPPNENN